MAPRATPINYSYQFYHEKCRFATETKPSDALFHLYDRKIIVYYIDKFYRYSNLSTPKASAATSRQAFFYAFRHIAENAAGQKSYFVHALHAEGKKQYADGSASADCFLV